MSHLFMVGVDGSACARRAVEFAAEQAKRADARLIILHVIEWSRYEFHAPDELAERHHQREVEIANAQSKILDPLRQIASEKGVEAQTEIRYGHTAEELCVAAEELGTHQIFVGRRGRSRVAALLFGSVAGALVQMSPVPVTVVP